MEPLTPLLLAVSLALPPNVKAIDHILQYINDLLMPETIDAAVYNGLQRVVQVYGSCRHWTVGAMDGAAARGRIDILQRLHETRTEGCSNAAFIGAAANDQLEVLQWLHWFYPELRRPNDEAVAAAGHGHLRVVRWLHTRGFSLFRARSALEAAAAYGHVNVVEYLLRQGNVGRVDDSLVLAARNGHLNVVKLFYSWKRFSPPSFLVGRALTEAVKSGHDRTVKFLMIKCDDEDVSFALCAAAECGQLNMVRLLLDQCVHNRRTLATALRQAVWNNNWEIVELLLGKILPLNQKFMSTESQTGSDTAKSGRANIVKTMLDQCESLVDEVGRALAGAAENNQVEVATVLLHAGEVSWSADCQVYVGRAARTVPKRHYTELAELLEARCDDRAAGYALGIAAKNNDLEMTRSLLKKCSGYDRERELKNTVANGQLEMTNLLLEVSSQYSIEQAVMQAGSTDKLEVLQLLLGKCESVTLIRIFVKAAVANRADVMKLLLGKVDELHALSQLIYSTACGHVKVLEMLLERRPLSHIKLLHGVAVAAGRSEAVQLLKHRCRVLECRTGRRHGLRQQRSSRRHCRHRRRQRSKVDTR